MADLFYFSKEKVERFLTSKSFDKDIISDVERRADIILQAIFSNEKKEHLIRFESLTLYYSVLLVVCQGVKAEKLYAVLSDEMLHRCILACAAAVEILRITVSSTSTRLFPAEVLERSGITAFDLSKAIISRSFTRHEKFLKERFKQHVNSFKEQLLESMVWEKGSQLYNSLAVARPSLSAEIYRLGLLFAEPMASLDETCAETEINVFFRELIMLGAVRIDGMVERLQLSQQTRENVYCFFQRILIEQTSVFFNRHIDQIILCCFYGVGKLSKLDMTFREIIHSYKEQPQFRPDVFHNVFIGCPLASHGEAYTSKAGQDCFDIAAFYEEIFIPSVRPLMLELGAGGATVKDGQPAEVVNRNDGHLGECLGSPTILPFPRLPIMSRGKVYRADNFRVAPLRSSEIIMLGAVRINGMYEKLELSRQIGENAYCLFQRILHQHSFLFSDFHIDQIILCCFHGVTEDLTFKEIIDIYRWELQHESPIFHCEFVDWPLAFRNRPYEKRIGKAHLEHFVKFNNEIFLPHVKPLLSELGTDGTNVKSHGIVDFINENDGNLAQCSGSPKILPFPSLPVMSPEEVSATHYVNVSPLGLYEIIMLGAIRITSMVEMLQLSQQTRENVYCLFQLIVHRQTCLFFNRHIDQIILCCFCGAAKISETNLTFEEIVNSYKKQPQCKPRVVDNVFVDWSLVCQDWASNKRGSQEYVDIFTFYNEIFLPSVEPLLLELVPAGATVKNARKRNLDVNMKVVAHDLGISPGIPSI